MKRVLLTLCGMTALAITGMAQGQDAPAAAAPATPDKTAAEREKALQEQEQLNRQFREFEQSLLRLAYRLERSSKPEDRERAANLKKAIEYAASSGTDSKFDRLIGTLRSSKTLGMREIEDAMNQNAMVATDIHAILAMLLTDNRDEQIAKEKKRIAELLKRLDKNIRDQKNARAHTEAGKMDKDAIAKLQDKVSKDTQGIAKDMAPPSQTKPGDPKKGKGGSSSGRPPEPSEPKPGSGGPKPPEDDSQPEPGTPGRKYVEEANRHQQGAQSDIEKNKRADASNKQDNAIKELEKARQRLEEILRQLREEEIERLLAALQARCEKMLAMQQAVYESTKRVQESIDQHPDKKPERIEEQKSLQLSDREEDIVREATQALSLLEAEGSAVAFPEVFVQVRDDMRTVARRLGKVDTAQVTQGIEQDIITTLKEMIEALKKQRASRDGGKGGEGGKPPDPKLLELINELRMIRSMQMRVNMRTLTYARQYDGEQALDPDIQHELKNLADRQLKIFEVTNNIYRGKNK